MTLVAQELIRAPTVVGASRLRVNAYLLLVTKAFPLTGSAKQNNTVDDGWWGD